ncbi:MAG: penicillin-binding protein 1A [Elusimicrobia bacterium]|nr:penicillin-binding protein 1A [Elusimicrobiota bacterium]
MKKWIILIISIILFFAFIERLIKYLGDIPNPSRLSEYTPSLTTKIYDINGEVVSELFTEKRTIVPLSKIPKNMIDAVIAVEDTRFFKHWGIDPYRIMGAFLANIKAAGIVEGGSTITQQLSKVLFLSRRKTIARKIKEVILAIQLERDYSKNEILEMYLNQIYFGSGAYGIATASKIYFGKNVEELTLEECALLAGVIRAPSRYSPFKNPDKAIRRRAIVLSRMHAVGFITKEQKMEAEKKDVIIAPLHVSTKVAPYFIDYIRQSLELKYGHQLYQGGLKIYTTLDKKMQIDAERVFEKHLSNMDNALKTDSVEESTATIEGALLCLDVKSGGIRAWIGGRNFQTSQFNRVNQAQRQSGSAFKVFVYTAAIENGYTPVSIIDDAPVTFYNNGINWELLSETTDFSDVKNTDFLDELIQRDEEAENPNEKVLWQPKNYSEKFHGPVLLRKALEHSLNICAIKVADAIGPTTVAYYAKRLGVESPLTKTVSIALGSSEVNLQEMTAAFGCIANSGIKITPYAIVKVLDDKDRILEEHLSEEIDAISPQTAFIMSNLLKGVIQHGTGTRARGLRRPAAGKTGTTNDCADAWFIGFTPQLACGVWVGYDDHRSIGKKMTGGRVACPIWTDFMKAALRRQPVLDFTPPTGLTFVKIDPQTGLLALGDRKETYLEAFLTGTEPKEFSIYKEKPPVVEKIDDETEPVQITETSPVTVPTGITGLIEHSTRTIPILPTIDNDSESGF